MSENQKTPNPAAAAGCSSPGDELEAGPPHDALFLVLSYLPLFELLSMSAVCVSLRDAVECDVLLWLQIVVDQPFGFRLSDEILGRIARKADGRLTTLALINCVRISDSGLHQVVEKNPLLSKLYVAGCTGLTTNGLVSAVQTLTEHSHNLTSLMIGGIYNIKKDHFEVLKHYLLMNRYQQGQLQQQQQALLLYHEYIDRSKMLSKEYQPIIDVKICPKCHEVGRVYDCSRESCDCRGCSHCILRCEECGRCADESEAEETVCGGILCASCWLQLSKCNHCNRPYCNRHSDKVSSSAAGFVCEVCLET